MGRPPKLSTVLASPHHFINRLQIVNKRGTIQRLELNDEQVEIIRSLSSGGDTLVLKPRQIGSTTAVAAYFFWRAYTAKGPETYIVLSHKMSSSKHILGIHKRFYDNLPKTLQRELEINNTSCIKFKDTGAQILAVSSEGSGGLRSFTATGCHISEFAFQENTDELKATALAALNGGQLCIESTANYFGDALHREIELYEGGMVDWDFLFFPWTHHKEYRTKPPKDWHPDEEGAEMMGELGIDREQLYWMQKMLGKMGEAKFRREYPLSKDDAYAQVEGAWIPAHLFGPIDVVKFDGVGGGAFCAPEPDERYAIGVDCGAGTGGDYSALCVVSKSSGQLCEVRRSNEMTPTEWSEVVIDASNKWNGAKVLVESNGTWGGICIAELRNAGVPQWTDANGKYWTTTHKSRMMMLEGLKDLLGREQITHLDSWTIGELRSFKMNERDEPFCPRGGVHHGDTVVALALAFQCLEGVQVKKREHLPQWIRERKIQKMIDRANFIDLRRYD